MPRKSSKPDDPEQSKRFIETAEEVGAATDDEALERAFKRVSHNTNRPTSPKRTPKPKPTEMTADTVYWHALKMLLPRDY